MLAMRPIDPVAIETQLASPDAPVILVNVSTIDEAGTDEFLPGKRLQHEEAPVWCDRQERLADVPLDAPSLQSDVGVRSFALAFVGMLCAAVIGFVSEIRPLKAHSPYLAMTKRSELRTLPCPARTSSQIAPTTAQRLPGRPRMAWTASG